MTRSPRYDACRRMRLTVDLRMYRHSGIGRYLRNLVPLLLPLLHADRIRILGLRDVLGDPAWLRDPRLELLETAAPIYSISEQLLGLRGAFRATDLLWVPHYNAPLRYAGKTVVTIHDIAPLAVPQILSNAIKRSYARLLIQRAVARSAALLCVSEFTQHELITRLRVPPGKITVTPLALDRDWLPSPPFTSPIEPHTEPGAVPYLLFVGNIKPNKNLTLLLRALAGILDRVPFRLILAGRMHGLGTGDDAVLRQAEAMGDRVRFAGEVDDAELKRLYSGAAALVMPSLYEGFGLPLLEAMSLDCPVLCSTAGSLPEVAGDAALYFDPNSGQQLAACLLRVSDDSAMAALRARGRARLRHFSFDRCAAQTASVLNRFMEKS